MKKLLLLAALFVLIACGQHGDVESRVSIAYIPPHQVHPHIALIQAAQPRAPVPDPRTPDQISQAACTVGGQWVCAGRRPALRFGAGPGGAAKPASWTVSSWVFDPQNLTGCASDSNNGTTATCGATGVGPIKTFAQVVQRWGTLQPRLSQDTSFEWLSSNEGLGDSVVFTPYVDGGSLVSGFGALGAAQTVGTVTINGSGFQAKNRTTNKQLNANLTASGAAGQLLVNNTHPSHAWAYSSLGTNVFVISQPMVVTSNTGPLVDTWATSDSVTIFAPVRVDIAVWAPIVTQINAGVTNLPTLSSLVIVDPTQPGWSAFRLGSDVFMTDVRSERYLSIDSPLNDAAYASWWIDCGFDGSILSGSHFAVDTTVIDNIEAGYINAHNFGEIDMNAINLDGDVIVDGSGSAILDNISNANIGFVDLVSGAYAFHGTTTIVDDFAFGGSAFWGGGLIDQAVDGVLLVPSGAGKYVAKFLNTGGLEQASSATAYSQVSSGSVVTIHSGVTLTPSALDTCPASASAFCGTSFNFGAGLITNVALF